MQPGVVYGVLELIWDQISERCPGTSVEYRITADMGNVAPVFIGQNNLGFIGGNGNDGNGGATLNCHNYGAALGPGEERRYRASYPGTGTPQGVQQVFSEAPAKIHIEVNE